MAAVHASKRYQRCRKRVIERDQGICQMCGITCKDGDEVGPAHNDLLTVDHIIPLKDGGEPFDMDNLQVLCQGCHKKKDNIKPTTTAPHNVSCVICRESMPRSKFLKHLRYAHNIGATKKNSLWRCLPAPTFDEMKAYGLLRKAMEESSNSD